MPRKSIIGEEFHTPKGGILMVRESNGLTKNKARLICECSICSQDKELWPYGSIVSARATLKRGGVSCGCSASPKWTEGQMKVRCKRACKDLGLTFVDFVQPYNANKTRVIVKCLDAECNAKSDSLTIDKILRGRGCPMCGRGRIRDASRKVWVGEKQESYRGGVLTVVADLKVNGILVHCSNCAKDPSLYGDGLFKFNKDTWTAGIKPCGCSTGFLHDKRQKSLLYSRLNRRDEEILGLWKQNGHWYCERSCLCNENHPNWVSVLPNETKASGCPNCAKSGFKITKPAYLYLFKYFSDDISLLKFGITNNNIKERLRDQKRGVDYEVDVIGLWWDISGEFVLSVESELKRIFKHQRIVPKELLPEGFTEAVFHTEEIENEIIKLIKGRFIS